ncbi:hypothetical protein T09_10074 [Trichinella sp. T9]|nr:hypothetical protein T09_10074 [Trichinella sp. T9]
MGKEAAKLKIRNSVTYSKLIAKLRIRGCRVIDQSEKRKDAGDMEQKFKTKGRPCIEALRLDWKIN